jgi:hypothetical protein
MKKSLSFLAAILISVCVFPQTPQKMSYQAVIRDAANQLFTNQKLCMQISILQDKIEGNLVYAEIHIPKSNENGLVTLEIGSGTIVKGDFSSIDWSKGPYFIKTETDLSGGTNFTITGTSELLSVPYAFHSKTAESLTGGLAETDPVFGASTASKITGADTVKWNNKLAAEVDGSVTNELQTLRISNDTIYLSQGGFVKLPSTSTNAALPPVATVQGATNIQSFSARINCLINASGFSTTSEFEWGNTNTYGNTVIATPNTIVGKTNQLVYTDLIGLQSANIYHYRLKATNAVDYTYSNDMTFTTLPSAPQLITTAINSATLTSAASGGNIVYDGGSPVTGRGVCYGTTTEPTISGNHTTNGMGSGTFVSSLTGLVTGTIYYARAYATNVIGTGYGDEVSFMAGIGANYLGGSVAYFFQPGDPGYQAGQFHGLIAAASDQALAPWGCMGVPIPGADGTALGTGNQNTIDIIATCTAAGIAARICSDLVTGGYSDWFLPSKDELAKLYLNKDLIGGFASENYWSSTEYNYANSYYHMFSSGTQYYGGRDYNGHVRAVRTF